MFADEDQFVEMRKEAQKDTTSAFLRLLMDCAKAQIKYGEEKRGQVLKSIQPSFGSQVSNLQNLSHFNVLVKGFPFQNDPNKNAFFQLGIYYLNKNELEEARKAFTNAYRETFFRNKEAFTKMEFSPSLTEMDPNWVDHMSQTIDIITQQQGNNLADLGKKIASQGLFSDY